MKNERTTRKEQTTSLKTEQKPTASHSSGWKREVDLVDGKPYFIAYGDTVYGATYSSAYQHFVGYNFHERGKPDYVFEAPEAPKVV